jgi:hypothetical protein
MTDEIEAFCWSYGQAMLDRDGRAIAGHYVFPYISFTNGWVTQFHDRAEADAACIDQIARFERIGVGSDIRLKHFRVEPVSDASALCHLEWEVFPANGVPGWSWLNIYGYRRNGDARGFEFNISDNEIGELLRHFPDCFADRG